LIGLILGEGGKRKLELRTKTNSQLFELYDGELVFHHRSARGLHEARRILKHFHSFLGEYPPSIDLGKAFLRQYIEHKPTTLYRYAAILKAFFSWYGEKLDIQIKVPKQLPDYVEPDSIDRLIEAMRAENKQSHKHSAARDVLLVDVATHSGLRRFELANLKVKDIDTERQLLIVRSGKGAKDRSIPLGYAISQRLKSYVKDKEKEDSLFGLAATTISGKIHRFAQKAGVNLHSHSLRDSFATTILSRGATIREVQELLGHSSLNNTERYTLLTQKHLRHAVELLDDKDKSLSNKPARRTSSDDAPEWVKAIDRLAASGKNYVMKRNGELEEV
jgi:site-specific recombinase XerD